MAKLIFKYGAMGSSKTANALMTKFNFEEKGRNVILMKPEVDDRYAPNIVKSRVGIESIAKVIPTDPERGFFVKMLKDSGVDYLIIDECQFLNSATIEELSFCVDEFNIGVWCYGLKTDFMGNLFEGSKRLLELSDSIEEIKTSCFCGKKAVMNARIVDEKIVTDGEQISIGGDDKYVSLCRKHWVKGLFEQESVFKKKELPDENFEEE